MRMINWTNRPCWLMKQMRIWMKRQSVNTLHPSFVLQILTKWNEPQTHRNCALKQLHTHTRMMELFWDTGYYAHSPNIEHPPYMVPSWAPPCSLGSPVLRTGWCGKVAEVPECPGGAMAPCVPQKSWYFQRKTYGKKKVKYNITHRPRGLPRPRIA